jgi:hypothetical protein
VVQQTPAEWLSVPDETNSPTGAIELVRETFVTSPQKSRHRAERGLQMPQSSAWRILRTHLRTKGCWLQLLQALNPQVHNLRFHFSVDFQQRLEDDGFAEKLIFSNEMKFDVCRKVNRYNVKILGT